MTLAMSTQSPDVRLSSSVINPTQTRKRTGLNRPLQRSVMAAKTQLVNVTTITFSISCGVKNGFHP
jgi:hypothetical protein